MMIKGEMLPRVVLLLLPLATVGVAANILTQPSLADPMHCDRGGYPSCYSIGYQNGQNDAQSGNGYAGCNGHSSEWCRGYNAGYYNSNSISSRNNNVRQTETSNINIHGNNNHVNVNQGQLANNGNSGHRYGYRYHHGGGNPQCKVICIS
jgi:hypothetical protein